MPVKSGETKISDTTGRPPTVRSSLMTPVSRTTSPFAAWTDGTGEGWIFYLNFRTKSSLHDHSDVASQSADSSFLPLYPDTGVSFGLVQRTHSSLLIRSSLFVPDLTLFFRCLRWTVSQWVFGASAFEAGEAFWASLSSLMVAVK